MPEIAHLDFFSLSHLLHDLEGYEWRKREWGVFLSKVSRAQTFLEGLWNGIFSRYPLWLETRVHQRMGAIAFPVGDRQQKCQQLELEESRFAVRVG